MDPGPGPGTDLSLGGGLQQSMDHVDDKEYFLYGETQDTCSLRLEYLPHTLTIVIRRTRRTCTS